MPCGGGYMPGGGGYIPGGGGYIIGYPVTLVAIGTCLGLFVFFFFGGGGGGGTNCFFFKDYFTILTLQIGQPALFPLTLNHISIQS